MTDLKTISINVKDEAKAIIAKHVKPGQVVLLTLDDGSNKYSTQGGTCTIGADFQLVVVDKQDPAYDIVLENNAGFEMYTSSDEMAFLTDGLVLNARNALISLSDNSGIIDGAVSVNEYHPHALTAEEMKAGKTC
ncbi:iron-sulfur cluster biosynthesis family protein [Lactobacillus psittaci]|uniref:Core domain-containing protein n=1 Tax=Lactobacillus psittaci DSM 15354 TaxID=1122152 RepID=A0A0R1S2H6_9LACO|nr:iron-sulfur cluster biosynthesis family protein [Lactobacillus psittaci]KRL62750.1 hypothetical protein FC23_GL001220 [Lactobacillus psittaci DSM 15354]